MRIMQRLDGCIKPMCQDLSDWINLFTWMKWLALLWKKCLPKVLVSQKQIGQMGIFLNGPFPHNTIILKNSAPSEIQNADHLTTTTATTTIAKFFALGCFSQIFFWRHRRDVFHLVQQPAAQLCGLLHRLFRVQRDLQDRRRRQRRQPGQEARQRSKPGARQHLAPPHGRQPRLQRRSGCVSVWQCGLHYKN